MSNPPTYGKKWRTSQVLAQLYKKGVQIACNPILPCVSVRWPITSNSPKRKDRKKSFSKMQPLIKITPYETKKGPPFRVAPSRASDSIKLLSRSDLSALPQMSFHELFSTVSSSPVATDEYGFDTCTWYTNVNAYSSYVNNHVLLL